MCNIWKRCFYTSESLRIYKDTRYICEYCCTSNINAVHKWFPLSISRAGWRPRMLPGAGWWCVTRASGSTSPPTSGSPRSSPPPGPRRGSAASPSTRYLRRYLQYLCSVSTIFSQFIYTFHCNEIFFQILYIFVQWHRPDLSEGLAHCALIQWSNEPFCCPASPHKDKSTEEGV